MLRKQHKQALGHEPQERMEKGIKASLLTLTYERERKREMEMERERESQGTKSI